MTLVIPDPNCTITHPIRGPTRDLYWRAAAPDCRISDRIDHWLRHFKLDTRTTVWKHGIVWNIMWCNMSHVFIQLKKDLVYHWLVSSLVGWLVGCLLACLLCLLNCISTNWVRTMNLYTLRVYSRHLYKQRNLDVSTIKRLCIQHSRAKLEVLQDCELTHDSIIH